MTDHFTILELNSSAINHNRLHNPYHIELERLLEESLDILGATPKRTVLSYLLASGISFEKNKCSSADDIDQALRKLLGTGAEIVLGSNWKQKAAMIQVDHNNSLGE